MSGFGRKADHSARAGEPKVGGAPGRAFGRACDAEAVCCRCCSNLLTQPQTKCVGAAERLSLMVCVVMASPQSIAMVVGAAAGSLESCGVAHVGCASTASQRIAGVGLLGASCVTSNIYDGDWFFTFTSASHTILDNLASQTCWEEATG